MPPFGPTPQHSRLAARAVAGPCTPAISPPSPTSGASRRPQPLPRKPLVHWHLSTWNVDQILWTGVTALERVAPCTKRAASASRPGRQALAGFLRGAQFPATPHQTVGAPLPPAAAVGAGKWWRLRMTAVRISLTGRAQTVRTAVSLSPWRIAAATVSLEVAGVPRGDC